MNPVRPCWYYTYILISEKDNNFVTRYSAKNLVKVMDK